MSSPVFACPLCSQPGFETLDSLRYGLISAATRQIICPVCHEILYGLDKFTIHLFSHSVHHQEASNSFPVQRLHHTVIPVNQQSSNLLICTQSSVNSAIQQKPHLEDNLKNYIAITDNLRSKTIENEDTHQTKSFESLKNKHLQKCSDVDIVWNEKSSNTVNCEDRFTGTSKDIFLHSENSDEKTADKHFTSNSESNNISHTGREDRKNNVGLCNINMTHQSSSMKCSGSESKQPSSTDNSAIEVLVKEVVKCDICGFTFDDSSILTIHNQLVHSTINIEDTGMSNNRSQSSKGCKQEKISDEKRQFPCHLCSKAFKMRGSLMVHLRVVHSSIIVTDKSLLGKMDPENHSEDRKFGCHLCSKSFRKEQHLTQHLKTHEGKQWECDVCSKMFTTKYFLKKHKRLHTGETPYSCDTCGKTFTFQQSYHKHLLYHSDDKPHVCTECDRAFKELSTLHNHQRIHTGEKPFACETCGKCFRQRVSYLVHRRIHTGVMPYQCTACGKSFRYKVSQRTHKCPSQPPGTVVRQSGELVQKLLQGVQRTQVTPVQNRADDKNNGNSTDGPQASASPRSTVEFKDFTSSYQEQQKQFTIVVGTDINSIFPSGQIILASDNLCSFSKDDKNTMSSINLKNNTEEIQIPNLAEAQENNTALVKDKKNSTFSPSKFSEEIKKHDFQENKIIIEDKNKNLNANSIEHNIFRQNVKDNLIGFQNVQEIVTNVGTDNKIGGNKDLSQESKFVHEKNVHASSAKSEICVSPSNSEPLWKSSNKKQKSRNNSDLVVETTDFFSMVLSPSGKSLPSPSERLKHLSLSSPVDTLLGYEDDGLYQFLLNTDNVGTSVTPEKNNENNMILPQCEVVGGTNNTISVSDSEPLETINEESLKHLLYGSSRT